MGEQIISFETAKLAKEKGFDYDGNMYNNVYIDTGELFNCLSIPLRSFDNPPTEYEAPTQSILQNWLREIKNIEVIVSRDMEVAYKEEILYIVKVINWNKKGYINTPIAQLYKVEHNHYPDFKSHPEALEKGLIEALKKIIK